MPSGHKIPMSPLPPSLPSSPLPCPLCFLTALGYTHEPPCPAVSHPHTHFWNRSSGQPFHHWITTRIRKVGPITSAAPPPIGSAAAPGLALLHFPTAAGSVPCETETDLIMLQENGTQDNPLMLPLTVAHFLSFVLSLVSSLASNLWKGSCLFHWGP